MKLMRVRAAISRVPIKWKLTIGSAMLLFMLFAAYNVIQYFFVEKWMIDQEKLDIRESMDDILNYFLETETVLEESQFASVRDYLNKVNEKNQLIRVIDQTGKPLVVVSHAFMEQWIEPSPAYESELYITRHSGHSLMVIRSPITVFGFTGTVEIVKNRDDFDELSAAFVHVMLLCGLGAILLSGLGGGLLAWQLLKPLKSMAITIRNVKQKGLQERMQVHDNEDEISTLMRMFNRMMDQVELSFEQQSQFVEDASHELRTPIAIVEGHLAMLQRWGKDNPAVLEEGLAAAIEENQRLKGLVQELLVLTRVEQGSVDQDKQGASPDRVIQAILKKIAVVYPKVHFETILDGFTEVELGITEPHLEQLLLIVLDNAVKYSSDHGKVILRGSVSKNEACIDIIDYGIGIPQKDLQYVFNRFYRVDKARGGVQRGYGLGLAIAKRLVERYGGTLRIQSKESEGTTVSIAFPVIRSKGGV
jgi:two-component system sensor histidine kinase ArlS